MKNFYKGMAVAILALGPAVYIGTGLAFEAGYGQLILILLSGIAAGALTPGGAK